MLSLNAWFWLNFTNALLGLVVLYYLGKVIMSLVQDLTGGRKEKAVAYKEVTRKAT